MNAKHASIVAHPAPAARCCQNQDAHGYPLRWAELQGEALHPLQYKFIEHVRTGLPRWEPGNYIGPSESIVLTPTVRSELVPPCVSPALVTLP